MLWNLSANQFSVMQWQPKKESASIRNDRSSDENEARESRPKIRVTVAMKYSVDRARSVLMKVSMPHVGCPLQHAVRRLVNLRCRDFYRWDLPRMHWKTIDGPALCRCSDDPA